MRKWVLAFVLAGLMVHMPWKVAATVVEAEWLRPGRAHLTQRTDAYWRALSLEARLVNLGYTVTYKHGLSYMGVEAYGLTVRSTHQIFIEESLSWNDRFAVLAHEGGHVFEPGWLVGWQSDVFAEMVAMLVADDGIREHARWLAGAKLDVLVVGLAAWPEVYHAAAVLSE